MEYAPFKTMSYDQIGALSKPAKCAGTLLSCYESFLNHGDIMKRLLFIVLLFQASMTSADLSDCKDLYIGKVVTKMGVGLERFTLVENSQDVVGSQWIYFTGWAKEDVQFAATAIYSAKMAKKMVTVTTTASSGCDISSTQVLLYISLQSGQ
ncbi:MAG: hypothetical protein COB43_09410 [Oceanospirillales bacterium]|nr:MAG: hypothetical protein COB43_09410 [Oceanospirillales bacterium]